MINLHLDCSSVQSVDVSFHLGLKLNPDYFLLSQSNFLKSNQEEMKQIQDILKSQENEKQDTLS